MNYFKTNLKYIRTRFDVTQAQLALRIETGQSTIATWENGSSSPDVDNLIKLNRTFGISIDDLILVDMAHGKVITDAHVEQFKRNGKVSGKLSGKVIDQIGTKYTSSNMPQTMLNEPDETSTWMLTQLLKNMHADIGKIVKVVDQINKKVDK